MNNNSPIDISSWKMFPMNVLFRICHGTRLRKQDMREGDINYIGASAFNNGITAKIGNTDSIHPAGTITVCYNGSIGQAFYQTEPFWATDDVNVLYPKFDLTPAIAKFLIPIIYRMSLNYAYIDKWTAEKMQTSLIPLPTNQEGEPDWLYMETYIKDLTDKANKNIDLLRTLIGGGCKYLNISAWRPFVVGELFPGIKKPSVYHAHELEERVDGIPYVVRSKFNNGIKCRVKEADGLRTSPSGVISFGAENSSFFYQKERWCSGRDVYYIDTREISPQACLFISSCLQTLSSKYDYSFGLFPDLLKKEVIYLPVDSSGNPDWSLMENYIDGQSQRVKMVTENLS